MKLYKVKKGVILNHAQEYKSVEHFDWDEWLNKDLLRDELERLWDQATHINVDRIDKDYHLKVPMGTQEVWAAGVTYYRSRTARMAESNEDPGGGGPYDRVYHADRPELFFKSHAWRVKQHLEPVRIRRDSKWNVPEPEFTLVINSAGNMVGYTIGNDMSSRSIEGENPLYLPQAKVYNGSTAIGPCVLIPDTPPSDETKITISIERLGKEVFSGETDLGQMKRKPQELAEYLYRELSFPVGCYLMTGTGIVPDHNFTLKSADVIHITINGIGTLTNPVE